MGIDGQGFAGSNEDEFVGVELGRYAIQLCEDVVGMDGLVHVHDNYFGGVEVEVRSENTFAEAMVFAVSDAGVDDARATLAEVYVVAVVAGTVVAGDSSHSLVSLRQGTYYFADIGLRSPTFSDFPFLTCNGDEREYHRLQIRDLRK